MKTSRFTQVGEKVTVAVHDSIPFKPFTSFEGRALTGVRLHEIGAWGAVELQHVEIGKGGEFAMHSSPHLAFCHIVRGEGSLILPGDHEVTYRGPETYVFEPHAEHAWRHVRSDTLLAVAIIPVATTR